MFELLKTDALTKARLGRLTTAHGVIETPVFMPVGTQASVKALDPRELNEMGTQIILGNTYHLNIRPGMDIIRAAGGLHSFMNWDKPILTDSGGFQVFSLSKLRDIKEEGVTFRSHLDGNQIFMSPEKSMQIQKALGSDIIMAFDECPPHPAPRELVQNACDQTFRWLERCAREVEKANDSQLLFGIVQGGIDLELRMKSLEQ